MIVYQLSASGPLKYFDGSGKIASRKVFVHREDAEEHRYDFESLCTTDHGNANLNTMASVRTMAILELELVE